MSVDDLSMLRGGSSPAQVAARAGGAIRAGAVATIGQALPSGQAAPSGQTVPSAGAARDMPHGAAAVPNSGEEGAEDSDEAPAPLQAFGAQLVRDAPSWMTSMAVHLAVLIIMALWVSVQPSKQEVQLEAIFADRLGEQLLDDTPVGDERQETLETEAIVTEWQPLEVDDPFSAPIPTLNTATSGVESSIIAPIAGELFQGRNEGMKQQLLASWGGTALTEDAVQRCLAWLARQQRSDGSWSLVGPYSEGAGIENTAAATSMALLAFQGAGHTHLNGKYKENVSRGIEALLRMQDRDGAFFQSGGHNHVFYTQGMATIAVCELYAMTGDTSLEEPARRAVKFCVDSQDPLGGGWKYVAGEASDTSVTGWILMGLQSARQAHIDVPQATLDKVSRYLDTVQSDGGSSYGYMEGMDDTDSMTAEGLLCRMFLGWDAYDPRLQKGAERLLENKPNWSRRDVYYWYYATQVLHHLGGNYWKQWNDVNKNLLVANQVKAGKEAGSWHPSRPNEDRWGRHGGRLYVTCLSCYMLEVYYRHMPLYKHDAVPPAPTP